MSARPVAWAMRAPGCDSGADWAELGETPPKPCDPFVASPLYDHAELDKAVAKDRERDAERWRWWSKKTLPDPLTFPETRL